jgi:hypothetical protein
MIEAADDGEPAQQGWLKCSSTRGGVRRHPHGRSAAEETRSALTTIAALETPRLSMIVSTDGGEPNHDEVASALSRAADVPIEPSFWDQVTKRVVWGTDLRACHAEWILSAFPVLLGLSEPVPADDLPSGFARRLLHATRADADPAEFAKIYLEHPATFLWAARTVVRRSFLVGHFEPASMIVARVAEVLRRPESYLEAAIVHAAAGRINDAARYLQHIVTVQPYAAIARPLLGMVYALAGRHADALEQLDASDGQDITYVRGVALRGIGRAADVLHVFENAIEQTATNALAWEQAARCCDDLAAAAERKLRAEWTTRANRYGKLAFRFGRPIETTGDRRRQ